MQYKLIKKKLKGKNKVYTKSLKTKEKFFYFNNL